MSAPPMHRGRAAAAAAVARPLVALALLLAASHLAGAQTTHLLVVTGIGGEAAYATAFHEAATALTEAAVTRLGVPAANVLYLAEDPQRDPRRGAARSTRANVEQALARLAERAGATDQIAIVLIGHGSAQGDDVRFNLPGPDVTAADLARALARFGARRVALVVASSASGDFARLLAAPSRVIITATKSGVERNATVFARYFADAFAGPGADTDKDGRVSLLEAFVYAQREVARAYEREGHLLSEHAQLAGDTALARTFVLGGPPAASTQSATGATGATGTALTPELQALLAQLAALRQRKPGMAADAYDAALERVLVEIAERSHALRARTPR